MELSFENAVLAVDSGGSRCRVAVSDGQNRILVETGPANVSTNLEEAAQRITEGLDALAARIGVPADRLAARPAYLALAGVLGPEDAEAIRPLLPFRGAKIEDDRRAAIAGALGATEQGAVVHCGTGSFFGVRTADRTRLVGGWGHRLGDEASAYWLVRKALGATLEAEDGLLPGTALTRRLRDRLGGPRAIVGFSQRADPKSFGALAPEITTAAEDGDPLARRIMKEGATHIQRTLKAVGWRCGDRLCLTGGVGPHYARYLPSAARDGLAAPEGAPIDGALAFARSMARERAT